jgi:hypothetical protein
LRTPAFAIEGPEDIVARSDEAIRRNAERLTFPWTTHFARNDVAIPPLDPYAQTRFAALEITENGHSAFARSTRTT